MQTLNYTASLARFVDAVEVSRKTFLVTGATGLIGSCMVDLLMEANRRKGLGNQVWR